MKRNPNSIANATPGGTREPLDVGEKPRKARADVSTDHRFRARSRGAIGVGVDADVATPAGSARRRNAVRLPVHAPKEAATGSATGARAGTPRGDRTTYE